jgi:hypothetical protein
MSASNLPDLLALTSRDRRLESMILLELIQRTDESQCDDPGETWASLPQQVVDDHGGEGAARTNRHAMRIAGFLARAYRAVTLEQKIFIAELAAEVAQRLAEEFPPSS